MVKEVIRNKYIVELPEVNLGVNGYSAIPRVGVTIASTRSDLAGRRKATSQYLVRNGNNKGSLMIHRLGEEGFRLENLAIAVPDIAVYENNVPVRVTDEDREFYEECALAFELAECNCSKNPNQHITKARELMSFVRSN
ncbi:MAG: hypothetical protein Q7S74_00810 [Nanoarchaeota archaeon]|nr:hypothetical protein [Nanoarchaeota archaeon]